MKRIIIIAAALFSLVLLSSTTNAQTIGKGQGKGLGKGLKTNWVDANGDGICDNVGTAKQGMNGAGKGYGKKDGTGNPLRPQDGTGYGKKAGAGSGTGVCDGTGPKGTMARRGNK